MKANKRIKISTHVQRLITTANKSTQMNMYALTLVWADSENITQIWDSQLYPDQSGWL